nr:S49 family peptidase [uncultured Holophaga sp.]
MKLLDIITSPWALVENRLLEIRDLYLAHTRREKLDIRAWESATGQPAGTQREPYQVQDGVAIIPIQGVMAKAPGAWGRLCGMTGTAQIRADLQTALDDPTVHSIVLLIDSPGGTVDGTQELAQAIFAAREVKPVAALADGCMCSAAMWAGAAASQVYITSDTTETGSIGVVATHVDKSGSETQWGQKTTEITAGKYKRIASQYSPLSEEGRATLQAQVDHIYSVFVDEIAQFRGVSVDTVLADMADGRVFLGKQAIEVGLVDGVSSLPALITQLNEDRRSRRPGAGAASLPSTSPSKENSMNLQELRDQHPDLAQAMFDEGAKAGASAELARVKGCFAAALVGYEDMAQAFALDGQTQPGDAALAINAQANADLKAEHKKTQEGGPVPLPNAGDPEAQEASAAKKAQEEKDKKAAEQQDPKVWATRINAHIEQAKAEGRTLSAAQAAAELRQQDKE